MLADIIIVYLVLGYGGILIFATTFNYVFLYKFDSDSVDFDNQSDTLERKKLFLLIIVNLPYALVFANEMIKTPENAKIIFRFPRTLQFIIVIFSWPLLLAVAMATFVFGKMGK